LRIQITRDLRPKRGEIEVLRARAKFFKKVTEVPRHTSAGIRLQPICDFNTFAGYDLSNISFAGLHYKREYQRISVI